MVLEGRHTKQCKDNKADAVGVHTMEYELCRHGSAVAL